MRFRERTDAVRLDIAARRRHLYVIGRTGVGKTTLLKSLIQQDIDAGLGVAVIDPHGDLAESIVAAVPKERRRDLVYLDATDPARVVSFNPLHCREPRLIDQTASAVVSSFKKLNDSWGPRLEDTLRCAVYAAIEQGGNLLTVLRLLSEDAFRARLVGDLRDPVIRSFWLDEFARWNPRFRSEAVASIQNKIRPMVTNATLRAITTSPKPSLDLRDCMDRGRIVVANLSKGRLGEDNSTLLGAFLVTALQIAALSRGDIPEEERTDYTLVVDEFQNFATGSFATILSEARKYRLSLVVAHQYTQQLSDDTLAAVLGNVGSLCVFSLGAPDAEALAPHLSQQPDQVTPTALMNLPKYTACVRVLLDGLPSRPFLMETTNSPDQGLPKAPVI